jgi:hypothetical protein
MYQITTRKGSPIVPFSNDDWAIAGPGARKGISMLLKKAIRSDELAVMRWLRLNQKEEFARLGLDFPYLTDGKGGPIEISISNIENCLCEFHKYLKIRDGTGRARRKFRPRYSEQLQEWLSDP